MVKGLVVMAVWLSCTNVAWAQEPSGGARSRPSRPQKPSMPPPTEADLGVPLYPGARFASDLSAGMSMNESKSWIFFSDDAPATVVAFYQQKTGKKATEMDKDKYLLALKGKALIPEHGVFVETLEGNEAFKGKGKTMISVVRNPREG